MIRKLEQPDLEVLLVRADKLGSTQWDFLKRKSLAIYKAVRKEIRSYGAKSVRVGISLEGKRSRPVTFASCVRSEFPARPAFVLMNKDFALTA